MSKRASAPKVSTLSIAMQRNKSKAPISGEHKNDDLRLIYEVLLEKYMPELSEQMDLDELFGKMTTVHDVKAILVGQDSYPDPEKITAMAFSYRKGQKATGSVKQIILAALKGEDSHEEDNMRFVEDGYLGTWRDQGLLLVNSDGPCVLELIRTIIKASKGRVCGILLGTEAQKLSPLFEVAYNWYHPSRKSTINNDTNDPRHWNHTDVFWRANKHIMSTGRCPINWATVGKHTTLWIFTDGGYGSTKREGASGFAIFNALQTNLGYSSHKGKELSTNNIAELTAIVDALKMVQEYTQGKIMIVSDSEYSIKSITLWYYNWVKKPDLLKDRLNIGLITEAVRLTELTGAKYKHIHGHQPAPADDSSKAYFLWMGNNFVDKLVGYG